MAGKVAGNQNVPGGFADAWGREHVEEIYGARPGVQAIRHMGMVEMSGEEPREVMVALQAVGSTVRGYGEQAKEVLLTLESKHRIWLGGSVNFSTMETTQIQLVAQTMSR